MTNSEARNLPEIILVTDVGSTTTKARLFKKTGDEYRFVVSGEAPTTVEAPYEDVTMGVRSAIREVEQLTGYKLMGEKGTLLKRGINGEDGVDLYATTSSAGGGLQMLVAGVIQTMTAESAERAALGAGAIVVDVMAIDDGRMPHVKIQRIRSIRPDMILIAGGTDGGTITNVVKMAELVKTAEPRARLGLGFKLPIIYAGNINAREDIGSLLNEGFALKIVDNIRPKMEVEITEPARNAIMDTFMEHVMSHAPGYDKLMKWTGIPIMPTPAAEGRTVQIIAKLYKTNVIGVGLGGATTNVYSIFEDRFVRTVSANLGMSYSICNVLKEAGAKNIMSWLPFEIGEPEFQCLLANKMIRPTTIPQSLRELMIEHAAAREALRLGLAHHKRLARGLRGVQIARTIGDMFEQESGIETYIDMMKIGIIVGTGGLLSHAPRRAQSALILIDGFRPEGVTQLFQDSVFMMPHLGILSSIYPEIAGEIFEKDCLVRLGTCIAPRGQANEKEEAITVAAKMPDGTTLTEKVVSGDISVLSLRDNEMADVEMSPSKQFDVGGGFGRSIKAKIRGGVVGLIIDARGRPLTLPEDESGRRRKLLEWFASINAYPR